MVRFYQGDGEAARAHLGTAMSLARPGDFFTVTYGLGHDEETYFHTIASWAEWWSGMPDRSLELARRGLRLALQIPSSLSQAMARHALATAHHLRGERDEAERLANENLALCTELGFPFWGGLARAIRGTQRAAAGDPSGLDDVDAGLDQLTETSNVGGSSFGMVLLAEANLGAGRPQDAVEIADLGLAVGSELGQPFNEAQLLCLKATGLLALDRPDEARSVLEGSLTVAGRMGARSAALQAAVAFAGLVEADEPALAASVLEDALGAMGDGASTIDQRAARDLLRRVCITRSTPGRALPSSRRAPSRTATTTGAIMANPTTPPDGSPVYLSGPMFSAADLWQQAAIAAAVEGAGYETYLPQRDGIEVGNVMAMVNSVNDPAVAGLMQFVREIVFSMDVYQLLSRCQSVVFNMDGRVPDDGSVVEAAAAFASGRPIVIWKTTPITMLGGTDNPMVSGLAMNWQTVNELTPLPAAIAAAVAATSTAAATRSPRHHTSKR